MRLKADFYQRKIAQLQSGLGEAGLDGMLVATSPNIYYLTGFFHHPSERPIVLFVPANGDVALLVPRLEQEHAEETWIEQIVVYPEFPGTEMPLAALAAWLAGGRRGGAGDGQAARGADPAYATHKLGYERSVSVGMLDLFVSAFPQTKWQAAGNLVRDLRMVKEPEEIVLMRAAAEISDGMVAEGVRFVSARGEGVTEAEVVEHVRAYAMERILAKYEDLVFIQSATGGLVCFGDHASLPHGVASDRPLRVGDAVILSLGCQVGGYAAESERTFFYRVVGTEDEERHRAGYEVMRQAQEVGTASLTPGTTCAEANRRCLDVIRKAGMGAYIRHRQGHGMGIMFHEEPWVEDGDQTVLQAGMVVSSEPGVYVPGLAGYRISDTVLVTGAGPECLTRYPRDWGSAQIPG